jgi:hypothetical protein
MERTYQPLLVNDRFNLEDKRGENASEHNLHKKR